MSTIWRRSTKGIDPQPKASVPTDGSQFVPAMLFGGLSALFGVVSVWTAAEAYLLSRRKLPITWYTRNYISWEPGPASLITAALGFALGAGITHFEWDMIRKTKKATLP